MVSIQKNLTLSIYSFNWLTWLLIFGLTYIDPALGSECTVTFTVKDKLEKPVYFYYQLKNFYQNQRDYVKSRDYSQQNGEYKVVDKLSNCKPIQTNQQLFEWQQYSVAEREMLANDPSYTMTKMEKTEPATPCGIVAKSIFNDEFSEFQTLDGTTKFEFEKENIAWETDKLHKFKNV